MSWVTTAVRFVGKVSGVNWFGRLITTVKMGLEIWKAFKPLQKQVAPLMDGLQDGEKVTISRRAVFDAINSLSNVLTSKGKSHLAVGRWMDAHPVEAGELWNALDIVVNASTQGKVDLV